MKYDKPLLDYGERIEKLKVDYNLEITNKRILEKEFLKTISYYDLINGYKDCFMINGKFQNENILTLFNFSYLDKRFQNILFMYSIYVENIFKTKFSNLIAKNKGVEYGQYLDINKYTVSNPKRKNKLLKTLSDIIAIHSGTSDYDDNPTKYYRKNHNHIPPWILFKNVKFTTVIDLLSFLNKNEKLEIINEYPAFNSSRISNDEKLEMFKNMLSIVRKFRNKIAHNYKFVGETLDKTSIHLVNLIKIDPFGIIKKKDIKIRRGASDVFGMYISILFLLGTSFLNILFLTETLNFKSILNIENLSNQVKKYLYNCNFPDDFFKRIETIIIKEKKIIDTILEK